MNMGVTSRCRVGWVLAWALSIAGWVLAPRQAAAEEPPAGEQAAVDPANSAPAAVEPDSNAVEPASNSAEANPVTAITKLAPDPSHIGDLLTLEVVVAYPDGYTVNLPTGVEFAPLELVGVEQGEPESTGSGWRRTFTVQLQYFDVGDASVPAFALTYVDPQGRVQTLEVASRKFTVESLLANENEPAVHGEDPPFSLTYPAEATETAIYVGLLALLAGLVLARVWSRWRRRERPVPVVPPIPPHERANDALRALESRRADLLEAGRVADYYLELTEIAKTYVQSRFGVEALDRTTDEIRRSLIRAGDRLAPLSTTELVEFLQRCDLVKFARFAPTDEDADASLQTVRGMVQRSTPVATDDAAPSPTGNEAAPKQEVA